MERKQRLERRQAALREAMAAAGLQAMIITGDGDGGHKGFVRYATEWRIVDGVVWVIFPLEGDPVMVLNFGSQAYWARQMGMVADIRTSLDKTGEVLNVLKEKNLLQAAIGVVGLEAIVPYDDGKRLLDGLTGAQVTRATDLMNQVLIPSTTEEIALAEEAHNIADQVHQRIAAALAPGKTEQEVMAEGNYLLARLGCLDGLAWLSMADTGNNRAPTDRRFEADDLVRIYVEAAGPSGYWTELGAVYSFRPPPELIMRKFNSIVKAMRRAAEQMRPGVKAGELSTAMEQTYRDDGWKIVERKMWDAHGQGLMGHLPPRAWPGSQDEFKENMILNLHSPGVVTEDGYGFATTSNYVVTPDGGRALGDFKHVWHLLPA